MSTRLVYHTPESRDGGESPFDAVLLDLAAGDELRIACPYLTVDYLRRYTERAAGWRLVTDVEAWLVAHGAGERGRVLTCLADHPDRIRHYPGLHAKVVVGRTAALVGSANLTHRGICERIEMGVLVAGADQVTELADWFEAVWSVAEAYPLDNARRYAAALPAEPRVLPTPLPSAAPVVRAKLREGDSPRTETEEEIVARCRQLPGVQWAHYFFDLAGRLVRACGMTDEDPRLAMTMSINNPFSVTINRRMALESFSARSTSQLKFKLLPGRTLDPDDQFLGLLMPASWVSRSITLPILLSCEPYSAQGRERADDGAPYLAGFRQTDRPGLPEDVLQAWESACRAESERGKRANVRNHHQPALYRMATDATYRAAVLARAFPTGG